MKISYLSKIIWLLMVIGFTQPFAIAQEKKDLSSIYDWLALVDSEKYFQSWQEASLPFKQQVEAANWDRVLSSARKPLGSVLSRELAAAAEKESIEGLGSGDYLIIQFDTKFTERKKAVETVIMKKEKGQYKLARYLIQ